MAKKLGLLTVVLLLATGGFFAWKKLRPKQVRFAVSASVPTSSATEVILSADGREVGRSRDKTLELSLAGHPGRNFTPEMLPRFSARLLVPCGWRDGEVQLLTPLSPELLELAGNAGTVEVHLMVLPANSATVTLWVDNREHGEVRLAVGQQERVIPANTKDFFYYGWDPACPGALEVKLDGTRVGELPAEIRDPQVGEEYLTRDVRYSSDFLVDTTGKRCYSFNEFCYAPQGKEADCGYAMDPTFYRPGVVHRLPSGQPDYFLEDLPKTIQVERGMPLPESDVNVELRTRLHQMGCG